MTITLSHYFQREGGDSPQPVKTEIGEKTSLTLQHKKSLALLGNNDNDFEPLVRNFMESRIAAFLGTSFCLFQASFSVQSTLSNCLTNYRQFAYVSFLS